MQNNPPTESRHWISGEPFVSVNAIYYKFIRFLDFRIAELFLDLPMHKRDKLGRTNHNG